MKTFYFTDELNDDFAQNNIKQKELSPDHTYINDHPIVRLVDFLLYRVIATPFAWCYQKIKFGEKIVGKKLLKPYRKTGYFLYGNHTRAAGDAFTPTLISFPKKAFIVTNPDSVSIPVLGSIPERLGAIPLPTSRKGMQNFTKAVQTRAERNQVIVIYPEAHIWPYYVGIRPFRSTSFRYPAQAGKPVFTFTVTYHKRKFFKTPKTIVYIDGPYLPDPEKTIKENQDSLRENAYLGMLERSKLSSFEYVRYVKTEK